jgi:putative transposase
MVAERESSELAQQLIEQTCRKQQITPKVLTLHADRGTSMTSKGVAFLLADLGVTKSHSRPQTSDDNPFSKAQFKTLKYQPSFPERFGCLADARLFCQKFFQWYNLEHHHTGIGLLTPGVLHSGQAQQVLQQRQRVLERAYQAHPERFVGGLPVPAEVPSAVWINPPATTKEEAAH